MAPISGVLNLASLILNTSMTGIHNKTVYHTTAGLTATTTVSAITAPRTVVATTSLDVLPRSGPANVVTNLMPTPTSDAVFTIVAPTSTPNIVFTMIVPTFTPSIIATLTWSAFTEATSIHHNPLREPTHIPGCPDFRGLGHGPVVDCGDPKEWRCHPRCIDRVGHDRGAELRHSEPGKEKPIDDEPPL